MELPSGSMGANAPGHAASHGCVGLYLCDERMQRQYFGYPADPVLEDAKTLYAWASAPRPDEGRFHDVANGPVARIIGQAPDFPPPRVKGGKAPPPWEARVASAKPSWSGK